MPTVTEPRAALTESAAALRRLAEYALPTELDRRMLDLSERKESLSADERAELLAWVRFSQERSIEKFGEGRGRAAATGRGLPRTGTVAVSELSPVRRAEVVARAGERCDLQKKMQNLSTRKLHKIAINQCFRCDTAFSLLGQQLVDPEKDAYSVGKQLIWGTVTAVPQIMRPYLMGTK